MVADVLELLAREGMAGLHLVEREALAGVGSGRFFLHLLHLVA